MLGVKETDNRKSPWMSNDPNFMKNQHLRIRGGSGSTPLGCSEWFPSNLCTVHALMPCNANKCCPMLLSSGQRLWCVMNSSVDTVLAKLSVLVESHGLTVEHKDLGCPCMPTHGGKRFIPSVFLGSSPPYILRQCLPLKRELTSCWTSWPAIPGDPLASVSAMLGHRCALPHPALYKGERWPKQLLTLTCCSCVPTSCVSIGPKQQGS